MSIVVTLEIRRPVQDTREYETVARMIVDAGRWRIEGDPAYIPTDMTVMTATGRLHLEDDPEKWARHYPNHLRSGYIYGALIEDAPAGD